MKGRRFLALDGMRGIAALGVLVIHMGGLPAQVLSGGYLAVDFFFCLSGFVLAHAYGDGALGLGSFLSIRFIRLYPLYLAGLVLGIVVALALGVSRLPLIGSVAFSLVFLPTPFSAGLPGQLGALYPLDPPAWSLFFEIVANTVWFSARRWLKGAPAFVALVFCAALFAVTIFVYGVSAGGYWHNIWGGFGRVFYGFFVGVLVYRAWRWSRWRPRVPSWLPAAGLFAVLAAPVNRGLFDGAAVMLAVPALVFMGACAEPANRLGITAQRALGDSSYAVYALHFPIILFIDRAASGLRLDHPSVLTTPLTIAVVLAAALWLDGVYDRPVRRWLTSLRRPGAERPRTSPAA